MSEPLEQTVQSNPSSARSKPRRRRWILWGLLFASLVATLFGACAYRHITTAPIDVANASKARALGWLALRDFADESDETREQLFDYYYSNLGGGESDAPSAATSGKKEKWRPPKSLQSVSALFLANSNDKTKEWANSYDRPAYVRIDYLIRCSESSDSRYVLSRDVAPGPALARRWSARRDAVKRGEVKKSKIERNIQTLVMQWFVSKYRRYDATPDADKKVFLERAADEMESLQEFYELARASATDGANRPLTRVELIAEFERMLEGWCEVASLESVAKAVWFKDVLITTVVAREMRINPDVLPLYPPRRPGAGDGSALCERVKARARDAAQRVKARVFRVKEEAPAQ